jgi:hypothetical protein
VRGGEAGPTGVHPAASIAANHCISVISASGLLYHIVQGDGYGPGWIRNDLVLLNLDTVLIGIADPDLGARTKLTYQPNCFCTFCLCISVLSASGLL